jgi:hypothetical protein
MLSHSLRRRGLVFKSVFNKPASFHAWIQRSDALKLEADRHLNAGGGIIKGRGGKAMRANDPHVRRQA